MTSLWQSPVIVVAFITWLTAPAASLGEAAQRETIRRMLVRPSAATLSNLGQPREMPIDPPSDARAAAPTPPVGVDDEGVPLTAAAQAAAAAAAKPSASAPAAAAPAQAEAAPVAKNDEKSWRDRMTSARESVERDEVLADAMQSKINGLQNDIVNRDDPAQQNQLRQQLARSLAELDRLKKQVETGKKKITDIQTDARRQGVPPGWIR